MRGWIMTAAAAALAGCAGGDLAGYGPAVTGGGGGLPVTRAVAREDVITPPGRRDLGLAVRSFAVGADGDAAEIAGAVCRISAGSFLATLATPGRLVIPDLGPDAPAIFADCSAGTLRGAASVAPVYGWEASGGNPPQRMLWGLGWYYGGVKTGPLRYPDLPVVLR